MKMKIEMRWRWRSKIYLNILSKCSMLITIMILEDMQEILSLINEKIHLDTT
jgi:hypothetical protein